jgi:hypothetical protein
MGQAAAPGRWTALAPQLLAEFLADAIVAAPAPGVAVRVLIDGPRTADPGRLTQALADELRTRGRPAIRIRAEDFLRDASLRLEHGRQDVESYYSGWTDLAALRREVLEPLGPNGSGRYLPSLRDPASNRATRAAPEPAAPGSVLLVEGDLLLGAGLPAEVQIHLLQSPGARARRMRADHPEWEWTLPALQRYDAEVAPADLADAVIRLDDSRHPAVRLRECL